MIILANVVQMAFDAPHFVTIIFKELRKIIL